MNVCQNCRLPVGYAWITAGPNDETFCGSPCAHTALGTQLTKEGIDRSIQLRTVDDEHAGA